MFAVGEHILMRRLWAISVEGDKYLILMIA